MNAVASAVEPIAHDRLGVMMPGWQTFDGEPVAFTGDSWIADAEVDSIYKIMCEYQALGASVGRFRADILAKARTGCERKGLGAAYAETLIAVIHRVAVAMSRSYDGGALTVTS